jgi:hypothetical protein
VSADADGLRKSLFRELFWTRTSLLLLVLVVISTIAMALSSTMQPGGLKNFVLALGTGTLISAVVGFGQTLITASAAQRVLVDSLVAESKKAMAGLTEEYRSLNREFFPTHVFEPTPEPDLAFNKFMTEDLRRTRQYYFRGFSGRHAAARLLLSNTERELRAVIADPSDRNAISGRAAYLLRYADRDYEAVRAELHDEICVGLVGLYLARSRCSRIDITIMARPPLDRVEIFDESVWITLFSDSAGATTLYPRTLRFSRNSFIYDKERTEFLQIANSRTGRHVVFQPDTSLPEFMSTFGKITGAPLTQDAYFALEERFGSFRRKFAARAGLEG